MREAIICDIDGCLIETDWIFAEAKEKDLNTDETFALFDKYANSDRCVINQKYVKLLQTFSNVDIIFVTARSEAIRHETQKKLEEILKGQQFLLYMRPIGNKENSCALKEMHLKEILKNYKVHLAIDDYIGNCLIFEKYNIPYIHWQKENLSIEDN